MAQHRVSLTSRFWRKVVRGPGCWVWTGARRANGTGIFAVSQRPRPAHRVAWQLVHGEPPAGQIVWSCGNRGCVRPDHLTTARSSTGT